MSRATPEPDKGRWKQRSAPLAAVTAAILLTGIVGYALFIGRSVGEFPPQTQRTVETATMSAPQMQQRSGTVAPAAEAAKIEAAATAELLSPAEWPASLPVHSSPAVFATSLVTGSGITSVVPGGAIVSPFPAQFLAFLLDPAEPLSMEPSRAPFVQYVAEQLHRDIRDIDRVYLVDGERTPYHLLVRDQQRQWWNLWVSYADGLIVDLEYTIN